MPCSDPGCLGCQDGETCDHQNPAVRLQRRVTLANDEREYEKAQSYARGAQKSHPATAKGIR